MERQAAKTTADFGGKGQYAPKNGSIMGSFFGR
jgi:hypothetical protein